MKRKIEIVIEHPDNYSADWLVSELMRYVNDINSDMEDSWIVQMEESNV